MAIKPDYSAGTASLASGGTTVTFAGGANLLGADIQPGDTFKVQNLDAIIATITDATHLELTEPWTGDALVAEPYRIRFQPDGSRLSAATRALIDLLGNGNLQAFAALVGELDLIPIFTGAGALTLVPKSELTRGVEYDVQVDTLAERATYNGQSTGFSVLVSDIGDGRAAIYSKNSNTSGDWSDPAFITGPNGTFQSEGAYNPATTYFLGDVVTQNGSSWIARVTTTGNAPPTLPTTSNTQWFLLSAAGSGFVFRGAYSGATAYVKDDVVLYNNSSWIALMSTTGNTPPALPTTVNTQWQLLAARGSGDVSGPASSVAGRMAVFADTTGKVLADGGLVSNGILFGLTVSNNVADATNDIDIAVGTAADQNNAIPVLMTLAAPITRQLDVAYGTGNGGRFDAAIGDAWWHVFEISNGTTVSVGMSQSLNPTGAPNYPSGYTSYRRIWSVLRSGGVIVPFTQNGDTCRFKAARNVTSVAAAYTALLFPVAAPLGIVTQPILQFTMSSFGAQFGTLSVGSGSDTTAVLEACSIQTTAGVPNNVRSWLTSGVFTNTSSQIWIAQSVGSGPLSASAINLWGYIDPRGRT